MVGTKTVGPSELIIGVPICIFSRAMLGRGFVELQMDEDLYVGE